MRTKSKFLTVALEAARKAEKIILKYYQERIGVKLKKDQTPVTIADTEAEKTIIHTLQKHFPTHSFLAEEEGEKATLSKYQWIIDPIDGTKNFVRGMFNFATQIALMQDGEIILGVSCAPALKEILFAEKGSGAYCNNARIHVSKVKKLSNVYLSFGGIKHFDQKCLVSKLLALANVTRGYRSFGDSWQYHLLACGKIDIVAEAHLEIWDIAALKIIVEEAGGKMTDLKGKPVDLKTTTGLTANKALHPLVLKYFH